ncbi:DUF2971 domain-containing protein [Sunxiuqinia elliptica]
MTNEYISSKYISNEGKENQRVHKSYISTLNTQNQIDYPKAISLPKELLKFYLCNENSIKVLKNQEIWASHPSQLNDPFDCSIELWEDNSFNNELLKDYLKEINNDNNFLSASPFRIKKEILGTLQALLGIYCLTETETDQQDLFWGYYNNHEGFAIKYDIDKLSKAWGNPFLVEYCNDLETQRILVRFPKSHAANEDILKIFYPRLLRWATIKKRKWGHENEWRYVFFDCCYSPISNEGNQHTRLKSLPSNSINEIILGFAFFRDHINRKKTKKISPYETKYDFSKKEDQNKLELLTILKKYESIPLYQIVFSPNLKLFPRRIYIKEIREKAVYIVEGRIKTD